METYEFNYAAQKVKFTLDGENLNYKFALKKGVIEFSKILYFRKFEYQDYDHFIIRYKNDKNKIKTFKSFAEKESQGLNSFLFRLAELMPDKDLSSTPVKQARKLMKVANAAKSGAIGAFVIIAGILAFIFRKSYHDIVNNPAFMIIMIIIVVIMAGVFVVVYLQGKHNSKDW